MLKWLKKLTNALYARVSFDAVEAAVRLCTISTHTVFHLWVHLLQWIMCTCIVYQRHNLIQI